MSLFAFASAKASPGSTTAALAVAAVWPAERRVLLAEADPAGGDLGPRFGLASAPGLVSLGSQRRRRLSVADVWGATQTLPGGTPVLVGPPAPEQAGALAHLWPELADVLAAVPGADILADCGRQYPESPALPLLRAAQVVVAVARPRLDEVAHLRARLAAPLTPARIEVVLMGTGPYPPRAGGTGAGPQGARGAGPRRAGRRGSGRSSRQRPPPQPVGPHPLGPARGRRPGLFAAYVGAGGCRRPGTPPPHRRRPSRCRQR